MVEYLAGNRIIGTTAERPVKVGGWKELDRFTGGSSGTITSMPVTVTNKRYYMFLSTYYTNTDKEVVQFNGDAGSTYAWRQSTNGTSSADALSGTSGASSMLVGYGGSGLHEFNIGYISNKSNKEKLAIIESTSNSGGTNKLNRRETVAKWTNTSDAISSMNFKAETGNFNASGAEVVVLGYDPDDTHTDNFWEELADVSWSSGANISTGTFTPKKYLWVQGWIKKADGGGGYASMRVGYNSRDDGTNYKLRYAFNGNSDGNFPDNDSYYTNQGLWMDQGNSNSTRMWFVNYFIINEAGRQKIISSSNNYTTATGAGEAPNRTQMVAKWNNTTHQINIIDFLGVSTGNFTGGQIKVWGSD